MSVFSWGLCSAVVVAIYSRGIPREGMHRPRVGGTARGRLLFLEDESRSSTGARWALALLQQPPACCTGSWGRLSGRRPARGLCTLGVPEPSALREVTPVEYLHSPGALGSQQAQKGGLASAGTADLLGLLKYTVCRNPCLPSEL